jgi:hypothetical protein
MLSIFSLHSQASYLRFLASAHAGLTCSPQYWGTTTKAFISLCQFHCLSGTFWAGQDPRELRELHVQRIIRQDGSGE